MTLQKITHWETWFADWMEQNPPAANLQEANNVTATAEINQTYFMETMDDSVDLEKIHDALRAHDYVFSDGGWLTK